MEILQRQRLTNGRLERELMEARAIAYLRVFGKSFLDPRPARGSARNNRRPAAGHSINPPPPPHLHLLQCVVIPDVFLFSFFFVFSPLPRPASHRNVTLVLHVSLLLFFNLRLGHYTTCIYYTWRTL